MKTEKKRALISMHLLTEISSRLSQQIGIFFPADQLHVLEKKLTLALPDLGFRDFQELSDSFLSTLLTAKQIEILAKHLTIGETYFFRDKQLFSILREEIFPDIIRRNQLKGKRIRVWSAACATGEEPYSIAILLNEMAPKKEGWIVEIIASDINPLFLKKAVAARYKSWSFRSMSKEVVEKNFYKEAHGEFVLDPSIASLVQFHHINLIGDSNGPLNPLSSGFDLILCNNVLIYFSKEQIDQTIKRLTAALADEGWLAVSAVEVPFVSDPRLVNISSHQITVFKKTEKIPPSLYHSYPHKSKSQTERRHETPPARTHPVPQMAGAADRPQKSGLKEFYESCQSLYRQGLYSEVSLQLTQALTPCLKQPSLLKQKLSELRLLIQALANQGKLKEALVWCQMALKADKLDPEIHYLHATLLQEMKEDEKAMRALRSALYLNPEMVAAHFSIGLMLLKQKEIAAGKKQLQNAVRLLQKMKSDERVPGMEHMMAGELIATIDRLEKR